MFFDTIANALEPINALFIQVLAGVCILSMLLLAVYIAVCLIYEIIDSLKDVYRRIIGDDRYDNY